MVGVLSSQFGAYDDTIPLPGGVGQDDYFSGADVVPLPGGADDFYFNPPDIGDYQPEAGVAPAAPRGPLAQAGAAMPTPPQQPDTTVQGPLAASSPQNLQMSLIDAAQQRIMDYRRQQDAAKAGQINMPLLAAAGALLSPTRTGSLGESIGNAFSAAAPAVQRQRAMDMQEAQARAKEDWNMAYQQAVLQDRGQWRGIQQQRADQVLDQWRPTGQVDENNNPILVNGRGEMRIETGVKVGAKPSATGEWVNTGKVDVNGNPVFLNKRTGETRVDTETTIGANPTSGGEWQNTGKVDQNGNAIMFNKRSGEYRVDTNVTVGANPTSAADWVNLNQVDEKGSPLLLNKRTGEITSAENIKVGAKPSSSGDWKNTGKVDTNGNPVQMNQRTGEYRVAPDVTIGAAPSAAGQWVNTGKVDTNGNPIQMNRQSGEYRVAPDIKVGATPGTGSNSASAILAREGLAKANAQIEQENAKRASEGKPPLTTEEVADIRINTVNGAKASNMPQSAKAQLMQMAVAAADDDLKNAGIDNPTPEQLREARIKRISEYTRRTSVYGQTVNALKRDVLDNWIAADPSIVEDPTRFAILNSKVNGGMIIKPQQAFAIEERAQQTKNAIEALQRVRKGISDYAGAAGGVGKALQAGEAIGNIVARMKETGYADVSSDLALARNLIPSLLTAKGTSPQSAHAISELQKIVRGGNWGDTYQNVMSNSEKMIKLLGGDLKHLNDFYKNGLGTNLSVFAAPGEDRRPFSAPKGGQGSAPAPSGTPPAAPRQAPQAAAEEAPGEVLPMPRSAAEAVVGKVYNTSRGPARWDGSKFIKVSP